MGHEIVDDPVEGQVVVIAGARQRLDALDVPRRDFGVKLDNDAAVDRIDIERVLGIELTPIARIGRLRRRHLKSAYQPHRQEDRRQ